MSYFRIQPSNVYTTEDLLWLAECHMWYGEKEKARNTLRRLARIVTTSHERKEPEDGAKETEKSTERSE